MHYDLIANIYAFMYAVLEGIASTSVKALPLPVVSASREKSVPFLDV